MLPQGRLSLQNLRPKVPISLEGEYMVYTKPQSSTDPKILQSSNYKVMPCYHTSSLHEHWKVPVSGSGNSSLQTENQNKTKLRLREL